MTAARSGRGPADPERPGRIIDAALSLMLEEGVQSLSHRAVAAKANVPLGSTTYYFKDLDALLVASIEKLTELARIQFEEWSKQVSSADSLAQKLSELIYNRLTYQRNQATLAYELYTLAMRRPEFRDLSNSWKHVLITVIGRHIDKDKAEATVALIDGIMIQGLISPAPPSLEEILSALGEIAHNGKNKSELELTSGGGCGNYSTSQISDV